MNKLATYAKKRDFSVTDEPPAIAANGEGRSFVVQKHAARRLHYDFRLELDGVLKSWAVPKGPSLSPGTKRLAVEVEDHPVDYRDFEGTIPKGQYGGGEVIVWDRGTWRPEGDPHEGLRKGHLRLSLAGEKLKGGFSLVRLKARDDEKRPQWLLFKAKDAFVKEGTAAEITARSPKSVLTGRTIEDIAAGVESKPAAKASKTKGKPKEKPKTKRETIPTVDPQLATLVDTVPSGPGWLFEVKLDGYRAIAVVDHGDVRISSRTGQEWSARYSAIAEALAHIRVKTAVLDGEICFLDDDGRTRFQGLQNALRSADQSHLVYMIFDLLYRDGEDLRELPLLERKRVLATILAGERLPLKLCDHVEGDASAILEEVCRLDLEGVIAKRADATYTSGRTRSWLKIKCAKRQEVVILGYSSPKGTRTGIGALVVGVHGERGKGKGPLRYVGKVGTGYSTETLRDLRRTLEPLARETPPVPDAPRMRDVTWVEPELVCEVRFTEWTEDGSLRHPVFMGLREDKPAKEVVREREEHLAKPKRSHRVSDEAVVVEGITITHATRVLDDTSGVTKGDLARYYASTADLILPYAKKRPLAVVRCPDGRRSKCFFQKHAMAGMGDDVHTAEVGDQAVLYVSSTPGLLELAQFGAVELHAWGSRLPSADKPDWIVLDLDPDEALPFDRVIDAALEAREVLHAIGLSSWVKTTGGKGLHVVVPFRARHGWGVVKAFAHAIAQDFERRSPHGYTTNISKAARRGKILVDYLRNGEGATAVLPYSARARDNMPVAMPVAWEDLRKVDPSEFNVRTVPGLLSRRRVDPWAEVLTSRQSLPHDLDRLLESTRSRAHARAS